MSNVWLTGGRSDSLDSGRKCLPQEIQLEIIAKKWDYALVTEDLLNRQHSEHGNFTIREPEWISILRALASLDGYISFVSFGVTSSEKNQMIISPKKEWIEIFCASTGELVVSLSYDTRNHECHFHTLIEWDEEEESNLIIDVEKYTVKRWKTLFIIRIQQTIERLEKKASNRHAEEQLLTKRAESLKEPLEPLVASLKKSRKRRAPY